MFLNAERKLLWTRGSTGTIGIDFNKCLLSNPFSNRCLSQMNVEYGVYVGTMASSW